MLNKEIKSEIIIHATPDAVWDVMIDFPGFSSWNPLIRKISGPLSIGAQLTVLLGQTGTRPMTFKPRLIALEPNRLIQWMGHMGIPGLFDGEHTFEMLASDGDNTLFIQRKKYSGILLPLFTRMIEKHTLYRFRLMNMALKRRVESTVGVMELI